MSELPRCPHSSARRRRFRLGHRDEAQLEELLSRPSAGRRRLHGAPRRATWSSSAPAARWGPRSPVCVRRATRRGRAAPARGRGLAFLRARGRARASQARGHRGHRLRPPRPRAGRAAARLRQRPLPRGHEVRRLGPSRPHLGHEHDRARPRGPPLRRLAHRRLLHRQRLPAVPRAQRRAARKRIATGPVGEYAQSCLGRERVFEHFSRERGTPCRPLPPLLRRGPALRRPRGHRRARSSPESPSTSRWATSTSIWQGDASSYALRSLGPGCDAAPRR